MNATRAVMIVIALLLLGPLSHATASDPDSEGIAVRLFPVARGWQSVDGAKRIEPAMLEGIKGQLRAAFLGSKIQNKAEDQDCSFITRALEPEHAADFHLLDVDGDGAPDIVYNGSAQCAEGSAFVVWRATKDGYAVAQEALWDVHALKLLPGPTFSILSVQQACCGGTIDKYYMGNLVNVRRDRRIRVQTMTAHPAKGSRSPSRFTSKEEIVLRSSPQRRDAYDPSLSEVQRLAVFGNVLSRFAKGVAGQILAERKDTRGRWWAYVVLDDTADVLRSHSPFMADVGWVERSSLATSR